MKKIAALLMMVALIAPKAFAADGAIEFTNFDVATSLYAPIFNTDGTTKLSGTGFSAQLYYDSGSGFVAVGPVVNFATASLAGTFSSYPSVTIPGVAIGSTTTLQVRAWDNAGGSISSWETATIRGQSASFTSQPLGDPSNASTLPVLTGLNSFSLVPEPTTIALGVLGGLVLLMRRRK